MNSTDKLLKAIWIFVIFIIVLAITHVVVSAKENTKEKTGYIFIGDSRTVGMNNAVDLINIPDTFVVAKSGMGYNWYMKEGSLLVYDIREKHKDYDKWIYIFNLGINDLSNVENYMNLYRELSNEATVYYVSINPTDDAVKGIQCKSIEEFNKKILSVTKDDNYINSYDYLYKVSGFTFDKRHDGMHYSDDTYKILYDFISMSIQVHEFVKENDDRYSAFFYLYNTR